MTREEKLATIAAAHNMFVQLMEATCPRAEIEQYRANVARLSGAPAPEPQETADDQARLEAVLAAARSKRASGN
jgi:hypothetical protein